MSNSGIAVATSQSLATQISKYHLDGYVHNMCFNISPILARYGKTYYSNPPSEIISLVLWLLHSMPTKNTRWGPPWESQGTQIKRTWRVTSRTKIKTELSWQQPFGHLAALFFNVDGIFSWYYWVIFGFTGMDLGCNEKWDWMGWYLENLLENSLESVAQDPSKYYASLNGKGDEKARVLGSNMKQSQYTTEMFMGCFFASSNTKTY